MIKWKARFEIELIRRYSFRYTFSFLFEYLLWIYGILILLSFSTAKYKSFSHSSLPELLEDYLTIKLEDHHPNHKIIFTISILSLTLLPELLSRDFSFFLSRFFIRTIITIRLELSFFIIKKYQTTAFLLSHSLLLFIPIFR